MAKSFVKLDRRELRKLKPGQKVMERGIEFRRLESGDGLYGINVMVDGQRIHRVVGRESEGVTRTQAEELIEKLRTDARHDRLALPKGRKVALSFRDAAGKYLLKLQESGGKNLTAKRQHLDQHLVPFLGALPLSKVSTFDIDTRSTGRRKLCRQAETGAAVAGSTGRRGGPHRRAR